MSTTTSTPMQCRHVFTDGHRCLGHCLRHEPFCYFHHTSRRPVENPSARRRRGTTFTLPELEDRASIQLALSEILQRIASNDLDPKRAGHLLYGLQIAATLLPKLDPKNKTQPKTVAEITHDAELGDLAPAQEVGADKEPSELDLLFAELLKPDDPEPRPELETLPTIQAAAQENAEPETLAPKPFKKGRLRMPHVSRLRLRWNQHHPTLLVNPLFAPRCTTPLDTPSHRHSIGNPPGANRDNTRKSTRAVADRPHRDLDKL